MLLQDITITIDLKDGSKEKYQRLIELLTKISIEPLNIHSYNPDSPDRELNGDDLQFVKSLSE